MTNFVFRYSGVFALSFILTAFLSKAWQKGRRSLLICAYFSCVIALFSLTFTGEYQRIDLMIAEAIRRIKEMDDISLRLFYDSQQLYLRYGLGFFLINVVGNIILFVPIGLGYVTLWKKNHSPERMILFMLLFPLFIETYQLMIDRTWDIDDLVLNGLGIALGYLIYALFQNRIKAFLEN